MATGSQNWHLDLVYDQWSAVPVSSPRPAARYKHAAAVFENKLYIAGGSRNGRSLADVQVLDLRSLSWSTVKPIVESSSGKLAVLPTISGHNMIKWGNKLLLIAGYSKDESDNVAVRFIDLNSHQCGVLETFGDIPVARSGQSVTLLGSKLIMFGGEDRRRKLLNDVHVLDLETMAWSIVETTQAPPEPRFDQTAAVHAERYLLIFGGCSHSGFFNDLSILDLQTMEWSRPQIQGDVVKPRAGHAGATIDENWYMVGGGDNKSGAVETLVFDMAKLIVTSLAAVKGGDSLASEGLSVSSAVLDGEKFLVAFGGYNGRYNNEVYVLRPKPRDSLHPKIFQSPAAAAAAASVTAAFALVKPVDITEREDSNLKAIQTNGYQSHLSTEANSLRDQKNILELSLGEITNENSALKTKLEDINGTYSDLTKELQSVQGQLVAERSRCSKLEAQISDLRKMLESMQSMEEEVQELRMQKAAFDRDLELATSGQHQGSGRFWRRGR
ncbi:hypothetical protein LIER_13371 [Lithospermum erythrorhizon]|uniref:Acyl-CoA-binding domain-containing protein n=1 Tax=Lithospermum erythrorhizon TaxID=34254 RepID=A0AAV3PVB6_LITER